MFGWRGRRQCDEGGMNVDVSSTVASVNALYYATDLDRPACGTRSRGSRSDESSLGSVKYCAIVVCWAGYPSGFPYQVASPLGSHLPKHECMYVSIGLLDYHQLSSAILIFPYFFFSICLCLQKTHAHHVRVSTSPSTLIDLELQRELKRYITSQAPTVGQGYRIAGGYPPRYLDFPTPLGAVGAATSASET